VPSSMGSESAQGSTMTSTVVNASWSVVSGVAKGIGAAAGAVGSYAMGTNPTPTGPTSYTGSMGSGPSSYAPPTSMSSD
jgi:hypothetical protein